jgi:hypothetical protein
MIIDTKVLTQAKVSYYATIKHDNGIINFHIKARNKEEAIKAICEVEGCPACAITEITT